MRHAWIAIACGACKFTAPDVAAVDADPGAADATDAALDAAPEGIDFLPPAEERFAAVSWTVGTATVLDTGAFSITPTPPAGVVLEPGLQDNGGQIAILRLYDFKVEANRVVWAIGDRPLAILVEHDVTIDGLLDVGGHAATRGAGGAPGGMGMGAGGVSIHDDGTGSTYDDSGAGGGSFSTAGARGGKAGPFLGGAPGATYPINGLVGGSGGGVAGACTNPPGGGGGALLLYAGHKITVKGAISAGGGGGAGGLAAGCATGAGAGAGGGSGGLIWIQTPDLKGSGVLAANGGGGGGASYVGIANGGQGQDGLASTTMAAAGGAKANSAEASAGGAGAVRGAAAAAIPDLAIGNAGAGGGGLGRVVYHAPGLDMLKSSPDAVTP
jgi:hypothetical protein